MLASPFFRAMLRSDSFQEGRRTLHTTGQASIPLPDDNPDALKVILNIIHFRTRQVPKTVTLNMSTHLSILVDKYQVLEAVETYINMWVQRQPYGHHYQVPIQPISFHGSAYHGSSNCRRNPSKLLEF